MEGAQCIFDSILESKIKLKSWVFGMLFCPPVNTQNSVGSIKFFFPQLNFWCTIMCSNKRSQEKTIITSYGDLSFLWMFINVCILIFFQMGTGKLGQMFIYSLFYRFCSFLFYMLKIKESTFWKKIPKQIFSGNSLIYTVYTYILIM